MGKLEEGGGGVSRSANGSRGRMQKDERSSSQLLVARARHKGGTDMFHVFGWIIEGVPGGIARAASWGGGRGGSLGHLTIGGSIGKTFVEVLHIAAWEHASPAKQWKQQTKVPSHRPKKVVQCKCTVSGISNAFRGRVLNSTFFC